MRRLVDVRGRRLHEEKVHQAVLVVVEPGHAGAHGLQIIFFLGLRGVLKKGDSRLFANVGKADGNSGTLSFWSLARKEEQMSSRAEQGGERQNCYEFDAETEEGSSSDFQVVPIPPGCVEGILPFECVGSRNSNSEDQNTDCSAGHEGAQQELSRASQVNFQVADYPPIKSA